MINSFNIGKVICNILLNDDRVKEKVSDKIYPLIADETTTFPFIIYQRSGFSPRNNKDQTDENVSVDIVVAAENYAESVDIAIRVREALEHKYGVFSDIEINDIIIDDASEDYVENTFLQNITITVFLENN